VKQKTLRKGTSKVATLSTLWIDVDSSVKTVYGKQEGVAKGYDPHKKDAYAYHPQLVFYAHTKETRQGWLRNGIDIVEFMKQRLAQLSTSQRIVFRDGGGYFVGALLNLLDAFGHGYLIKIKYDLDSTSAHTHSAQALDPYSDMKLFGNHNFNSYFSSISRQITFNFPVHLIINTTLRYFSGKTK